MMKRRSQVGLNLSSRRFASIGLCRRSRDLRCRLRRSACGSPAESSTVTETVPAPAGMATTPIYGFTVLRQLERTRGFEGGFGTQRFTLVRY
jgi:hypothetical protein